MILTTMTGQLSKKYDDKTAIKMIAEAGFDSYDYSCHVCTDDSPVYGDNYREYAAELRDLAEKYNLPCTQAHSIYPSAKYGEDEFNKLQFEKIVRNMEFVSLLGAKSIVVHPIKGYPEECDMKQINIDFYNRLLPYCKKFNIKVCLENMFVRDPKRGYIIANVCGYADEFKEYLEALDSEWFTGCLDIGHSGLVGEEPQNAIRILGKKYIHALHVHDNDYKSDMHTLPFVGKIEWEEVCKAFAEIDYDDEFTYEADRFLQNFPNELLPEALSFMCSVGRYLVKRIEELKK